MDGGVRSIYWRSGIRIAKSFFVRRQEFKILMCEQIGLGVMLTNKSIVIIHDHEFRFTKMMIQIL